MVQRKQARKKPKDSAAVHAEEGLNKRGGGDPGGGVGMARALLPNYMRATSCSGAKAGRASGREAATAPPPPPPKREQVRAKAVFAGAPPHAGRATCSSSMKGPVSAGPPAAAHVCSYAFCSVKDHVHASVVPLNTFLASRRRLIKTQQSMKLKGASPFRKPNNGVGDGYFVEIRAGAGATGTALGSDVSCSDLSAEEMDAMARRMDYVTFDHLSCGDDAEDKAKGSGASVDYSCGSSDVISDGAVESVGRTTKIRDRKEKETFVVDHEDDYFGACKSDISEELDVEREGNNREGGAGDAPKECSSDGISSALSGISFEDVTSECTAAASSQRKKWHISGRRTSEEGSKQMCPFRPKAPNFLPVQTGPEAEKVDLRHQGVNDRRGAEEWMVDYALRKAVKKLARAQKRKVEMLVQAFETVLPTVASEKKTAQQDDADSSFALSRPSQACS